MTQAAAASEADATAVTDDDIRRVVSRNAFDAGMAYQLEGRVGNLKISADGHTVTATVRGSGRATYRQSVNLSRTRSGTLIIAGSCTCPVGRNCKHVAAVMFAVQDDGLDELERLVDDRPSRPNGARPSGPATSGQTAIALPSPELHAWLNTLAGAREDESDDYPASVRKRLIFVLRPEAAGKNVSIELVSADIRPDGGLTHSGKRYESYQILHSAQQPKFFRPSDRGIIRRLAALGHMPDDGGEFIETLRRAIATGRARWRDVAGPELREGPPIPGRIVWQVAQDGTQRPDVTLPDGLESLRLGALWYADTKTGAIGPVDLGMPDRLARALLAAPSVPPEVVRHVGAELSRRLPGIALPPPVQFAEPVLAPGPPVPHLSLFAEDIDFSASGSSWSGPGRDAEQRVVNKVPMVRLSFQYGPVMVPAKRTPPSTVMRDGQLYRVVRTAKAEAAHQDRLTGIGFTPVSRLMPWKTQSPVYDALLLNNPTSTAWIDFVLHNVPALRAAGWIVDTAEDFPVQLATATGDITAEIHESSGIDWFELDLGVMVDGQRIDLLPPLLAALDSIGPALASRADTAQDDTSTLLVRLPDGRLLPLPLAKLRPFLGTLLELFAGGAERSGGRAKLSRSSAADLALAESAGAGAGIVWKGGDALRLLGRRLREADGIPRAALPENFAATLRPYQARGVDWLQFLREGGMGGVLADDMGLGKTVQTLAHLAIEQAEGRLDRPALVVCPTSLVANWQTEAARFAPSLRVLALRGPDRRTHFGDIGAHDLVIATYPLLTRDHETLVAQEWHVVVLDEAQTIKNPQAGTTKLAGTLRGRQRLCLSGTPLENHLGELWSLFDFLMPGFLGAARAFNTAYRTPIERGGDEARRSMLQRQVSPFLLRRTKSEVASDLPPKTEIVENVEFEDAQRAVYEGVRLTMHAKVRQAVAERGLARSGIVILDALLKLRQACCDPRLLKLQTAKAAKARSAKLERLMEMLPELLEEGRRVLLFSQFTSMLALIAEALEKAGLGYVLLTGDTVDRATPVRRFQSGEVPLFLISLKAGGVGLNLTAADTVIHYDPWWNPAVENQATDRAHRIGQDKNVFVHRLITRGTIEEKMEVLKARKQALVSGILGAAEGATLGITEADLAELFAEAA